MSERAPHRADSKREKALSDKGPIGPYKARVRVVPIKVAPGVAHFEVRTDWTGPPLPNSGFAPVEGDVEGSDIFYARGDVELAKAIAGRAVDLFKAGGEVPELRLLARASRGSRRG